MSPLATSNPLPSVASLTCDSVTRPPLTACLGGGVATRTEPHLCPSTRYLLPSPPPEEAIYVPAVHAHPDRPTVKAAIYATIYHTKLSLLLLYLFLAKKSHVVGCECELCTTEFPLRTHLLIDMSYSRLNQEQQTTPKTSTGSRFSFFSRKKTSNSSSAAQAAASLALLREQRRIIAERALKQAEEEEAAMASSSQVPVTLSTLKQDSLMIPAARMAQFFPAGHPIPTSSNHGRLRLLEAPEQNIQVVFHMMGHATHVTPALCSPLQDLYTQHRDCVLKAFRAAVSGAGVNNAALQGMVLLNLERGGEMGAGQPDHLKNLTPSIDVLHLHYQFGKIFSSFRMGCGLYGGAVEYPFMMVWVVDGRQCDSRLVISKLRQLSLEVFDPAKTGFSCPHYFDTFEEVAMLARPPLEKLMRKATTSATGYILTVFKVFEGDDSVKFERNWLSWTGTYPQAFYFPLKLPESQKKCSYRFGIITGGRHRVG
ncbi:hypothetical protein E2C01_014712 [Portunus trituberculatus]|uniref:DUF7153 domain-containing protein n=1 Tax=Portunus trituberculatus TaxID=210409 RepID=A0A5B7DJY5_PORTR|nr:hypothetical protein [Portunus trituberculatus]